MFTQSPTKNHVRRSCKRGLTLRATGHPDPWGPDPRILYDTSAALWKARYRSLNGYLSAVVAEAFGTYSRRVRPAPARKRGPPHPTSASLLLCFAPSSATPWVQRSQLLLRPALRARVSWGSQEQPRGRPFQERQATLASPELSQEKLVSAHRAANARMTLSSCLGATFAKHWTASSLTIASPTSRHLVTAATANSSLTTKSATHYQAAFPTRTSVSSSRAKSHGIIRRYECWRTACRQ